ncbi:SpaA isopeptide-forming pilin-related protein [Lacticaseibacillus sp. N501-2]|uniref:SpaA isopeptide-forming pilin-related protein n=1 Tax=Lacticaseibacillus salsurae TaxID=3367729 RepID=UPI0038B3D4E5
MKEQKSHMSLVARFVYIFATIVTVFAQMGAAVPAMITAADDVGLELTKWSKSPYDVDSDIRLSFSANLDNYPKDKYRDIQFKINETDENGKATNSKATFDPAATKAYAEENNLTVSGPTKSEDHTEYTYSNDVEEYHIWVFADHSIRVEWPKGTTGTKAGFIAMKAKEASTKVTLTPTFVGSTAANDTPVDLQAGKATDFIINPAPVQPTTQIDGSTFRFEPGIVGKLDTNEDKTPYRVSAFPLFYTKDDSTYAFTYNNNAVIGNGGDKNALNNLRKAVIAGAAYGSLSGAKSTTNKQPAYFENFHEINADGTIKTGTEKKFEVGKTYTLLPYNPAAGTKTGFMRINDPSLQSYKYYMPDGLPQITVDESGMHLTGDSADGHAVKGQWQATGTTLSVKLYHVKKVKVVDQDDHVVKGATLTLKNTSGNSSFLHGTTKDDGTGDLYPSDNPNSDATHPFYYPAGDEAFDKLTLPAGYTQDIAFSGMTLDTKADTLSLSDDAKNAKIVDDNQTLQLTVHHDDPNENPANSQVNIKKVSKDDGKALAGATFNVVEQKNTTGDSWNTPSGTTLTSDASGMVPGIAVDAKSNATTRTFLIAETHAPQGYAIGNSAGYFATWTKGKGFTSVGMRLTDQSASSSDGLVSIDAGTLVIADPKASTSGGTGNNGGTLTIKKIDKNNPNATVPDGATFTITIPATGDSLGSQATKSGKATFNLGQATSADKVLKVVETIAPAGYEANTNKLGYYVRIQADGTMTVADGPDVSSNITKTQTTDGVIKVATSSDGHMITFGDVKQAGPGNGGFFSLQKLDKDNALTALSGADFTLNEVLPNEVKFIDEAKTGTDGKLKFDLGTPTSQDRYFELSEKTAPVGYTPAANAYAIKVAVDGTVSVAPLDAASQKTVGGSDAGAAFKAISTLGFAPKTTDGTVTVDGIGVKFLDSKIVVQKDVGFSMKKTDASDPTKGVTGAAKFTIQRLDANQKAIDLATVTTSNGDVVKTLLKDQSVTKGIFSIHEDTAPAGYVQDTNTYYFSWNATAGVTGVSKNFGTTDFTDQSVKNADGKQVLAVEKDVLNFSDVKTPAPVIKLKKQNAQGQPLSGAKMVITETKANGGSYGATDKLPQQTLITHDDGIFQFTPTATAAGSTHYYKVTEETAPAGYAIGKETLIVYKVGTGVIGVKTVEGNTVADSAGPMTWSKADQLITYTDQPLSFKLQVRRQVGNADNSDKKLESVKKSVAVKLEDLDDPGLTLNYTADSESGDITVDEAELAAKLKLGTIPSTGQINFRLTVDPASASSFTVPAPRNVIFKWGATGGFFIDTKQNDQMVSDFNTTKPVPNNPMTLGNLRIMLRRDTLVAQPSATDENGQMANIPNAAFNLTYQDANGQVVGTQMVTTNKNGVGLIQEPSAIFKGNVPLKTDLTVTMTQAENQTVKGYEQFDKTATLTYNTENGFTTTQPGSIVTSVVQYDPESDGVDSELDAGIGIIDSQSGITAQQFYFGGTQLIVPLDKIINVDLVDVPQRLNFGHAEALSGPQTLNLLPNSTPNDQEAQFDLDKLNDTTATTTETNDESDQPGTDVLRAKVLQDGGPLASGWQLKLGMSQLTSENGDTISGGSVTLGKPTVSRGDEQLDIGTAQTVSLGGDQSGSGDSNLVETGIDSDTGDYTIDWDVKDVKMNLPANVGANKTNYQSTMTWALTWAP